MKNVLIDDFMHIGHDQLLILHSDKRSESLDKFTLFVHASKIIRNGELIEGKFDYLINCIRKRKFEMCPSLFSTESIAL